MGYRTTLDFDADAPLHCSDCDWRGPAGRAMDLFEELIDVRCPSCDKKLGGLYMFPTADEVREGAAAGNLRAIAELDGVEKREERLHRAQAAEITQLDQLRDVRGRRSFVVRWDLEEHDDDKWAILRVGRREIGRELAYWEGLERFRAVAELLARRYPGRVRELRPDSGEATTYLLGDRLAWMDGIEKTNAQTFPSSASFGLAQRVRRLLRR